ncbi:ChrR family anti-sigma-E factor [Microbulbifer marinus]|uniref:Anti-ECFsigma factor, ChrR n=1 Tax=Microbulbifer marinus TaxID=658218 RepID=A0A1H3WER5_9GAMM|nr:ChrR family anti-sigma-E factor [Microbulbifer marinus]SDZ84832.1 anti-ECFsigma factor, ChrR [Microbulbifer marinus]
MIRHHPDHNLLLEYAAGSLPWALSLVVAAHVQLCPQCRSQYQTMNRVGGSLLQDSEPQPLPEDALQRLMRRIATAEQGPDQEPVAAKSASTKNADPLFAKLPRVIRKLVDGNEPLKWKRVSPALRMSRLYTGQEQYEVAFHRIHSGGKVAEHDHRGREITLVLYGSFSDKDGVYGEGDFLVREPGEVHRPIATQDQECLCFSVVEAPVTITGPLGWLINPFLSFRPG